MLRRMTDRVEIIDCLHRYTRGVDRVDPELLRSAYHDGATDYHGRLFSVDEFINWLVPRQLNSKRTGQHYLSNISIDLGDGEAYVESYFISVATPVDAKGPVGVWGGRYIDRFERRAERWAIVTRRCLTEWQTEFESALPEHLLASQPWISRSQADSSYERPLQPTPPQAPAEKTIG